MMTTGMPHARANCASDGEKKSQDILSYITLQKRNFSVQTQVFVSSHDNRICQQLLNKDFHPAVSIK